jgi:hypothetical protein
MAWYKSRPPNYLEPLRGSFPPKLSDIDHVVGSLTWCRIRTGPRAHADDDVEIRIPV